MDTKKTLAQIHEGKLRADALADVLAQAPFHSLTPILSEVFQRKAGGITPVDLLQDYDRRAPLFSTGTISQRELCRFQSLFFDVMPGDYESVCLSPAAPLGSCAALTKLGQNERLSALRRAELVSDSTVVLAAHAASRRKEKMNHPSAMYDTVNLATFHRLLRLQRFAGHPEWTQHFEILGTVTAGRQPGKNHFHQETVARHIQLWIDFFRHLNRNGYDFRHIRFAISYLPLMEQLLQAYGVDRQAVTSRSLQGGYDYFSQWGIPLPPSAPSLQTLDDFFSSQADDRPRRYLLQFEEQYLRRLRADNPDVAFSYELNRKLGFGYFTGLCFHGYATTAAGEEVDLIDGGVSDWTAQLLSDRHELTVSSSLGAELAVRLFRAL